MMTCAPTPDEVLLDDVHPASAAEGAGALLRLDEGIGTTSPVLVCFGTRPEVVKLAPVIARLEEHPSLHPVVVTTAQHRQMLDQALAAFGIVPDLDLDLMDPGRPLTDLAGSAIQQLGGVLSEHRPAAVVVHGDTTTALCAALAGFYAGIPVAHVEAGLRTWDRFSPFPEEANRQMIGTLADWHFCPTATAADNLLREGVDAEHVYITGNTVVDALEAVLARATAPGVPPRRAAQRVLVTVHRRETQGEAQRALLRMLARVARDRDVELVLPVHLNPAVRRPVIEELGGCPNVHLVEPLPYAEFVVLLRSSDVVLTDSGGVQEEASALGVPLLVMRDTTERPEAVEAGCAILCGTEPERVARELERVLDRPAVAARMANAVSPFGDGRAAHRIADVLAARIRARYASPCPEPVAPAASWPLPPLAASVAGPNHTNETESGAHR